MTGDMIIRPWQSSDHKAVLALHANALKAIGAWLGNGPWDEDLDHIEQVYIDGGGCFLVAVIEDQIVGMGALQITGPDTAEIKRMRVDPAHQGQGIGRKLLHRLEDFAKNANVKTLTLDTTIQQQAAQHLYEQQGYREVRHGKVGPFDTRFFQKTLK